MRVEQIKSPLVEASVVRAPSRAPHWVIPTIKLALVIADGLIAALSFAPAFYLREGGQYLPNPYRYVRLERAICPYGALILFIILIRVLALLLRSLPAARRILVL